MRKFLKLFLVLCASLCVVTTITSCNGGSGEVQTTVKSIAVDANSVPAEIIQGEAETEIAKIKLVVTMSDDTTKTVNVTKDMISAKDLERLADLGTYKVTITYEGKTVEVTLRVVEAEEDTTLTDITLTVEQAEVAVNYGASHSVLDGVKAIGNDGVSYASKLTYVITNKAGETVDKLDTQKENEEYTIVISINYAGISKSVTKKVTVGEKPDTSGNLLPNGQFVVTDGVYAGWDLYVGDGGAVTLESETINGTSYAKFIETACASTAYGNRLNNNSSNYFTLYSGQAYQVSFYAKADQNKKIQCQVGQLVGGAPYFYDFAGQMFKFELTTEMQLYTFTFVAGNAAGGELSASSVTFEMGMVDGDSTAATIWLGEVAVTEYNGTVADTLAPVITASNKTIYIGDYETVNLADFVTAVDAVDGPVTPTYVIKNEAGETVTEISGTVAGVYTVEISAEDAAGNVSEASIILTVKERKVQSSYNLELVDGVVVNGDEATMAPDTLTYWNDQNWVGSNVTMVQNAVVNGVATFEYTATGACPFGFQLFYKNTSLDEGATYTLKLKINVATAITATINGTVVELAVGDNMVEVVYTESNGLSSLDFQFPIDNSSNTISISEVSWSGDNSKIKLEMVDGAVVNGDEATMAPDTLTYWNDQNWVGSNVTMVQNAVVNGVATFEYTATGACAFGFQLFYKNTSLDEGATYTLRLKINVATAITATINGTAVELAVGDNMVEVVYTEGNGLSSLDFQFPIDNSSNTISISEVSWDAKVEDKPVEPDQPSGPATESVNFEMENTQLGFAEEAAMADGQIGFWNDQNWCGSNVTINAANVTNNEILIDFSATGACTFGLQLFYNNSLVTVGQKYKLSLTITVNSAMTITVNNNVLELVAGVNNVEIEYEAGINVEGGGATSALDIQVPIDNNANVIKLSNISWVLASANTATESVNFEMENTQLGFAEEAAMTDGQIGFWNDQNWCGSNVTINAANVTNNEILIDFSATGACTFGLQLFYKNASLTVGQKYKLSLTITVNSAMTITVNNNVLELVAGVNNVEIVYEAGVNVEGGGATSALDIQVPINNNANVIKLSNITWTVA